MRRGLCLILLISMWICCLEARASLYESAGDRIRAKSNYIGVDQEKFDSVLSAAQLGEGPMVIETYAPSGVPMLCEMPEIVIGDSGIAEQSMPKEIGSVASFLLSLRGQCMRHVDGWWTYEFCFGKHIRQYHANTAGKLEAEYVLGRLLDPILGNEALEALDSDSNALLRELVAIGHDHNDLPYYAETYQYGTACDIGSKSLRKIEVHWSCSTGASTTAIRSIKEPSSCQYVMEIDTPLLCQHPSYRSNESPIHTVSCYFVHSSTITESSPSEHDNTPTPEDQETTELKSTLDEENKQNTGSPQNDVELLAKHALNAAHSKRTDMGLKMKIVDDEVPPSLATDTLIESVKTRSHGKIDLAATKENTPADSENLDDFEILTDAALEELLRSLSDTELLTLLSAIEEALSLSDTHEQMTNEKLLPEDEKIIIAVDRLKQKSSTENSETSGSQDSKEEKDSSKQS